MQLLEYTQIHGTWNLKNKKQIIETFGNDFRQLSRHEAVQDMVQVNLLLTCIISAKGRE